MQTWALQLQAMHLSRVHVAQRAWAHATGSGWRTSRSCARHMMLLLGMLSDLLSQMQRGKVQRGSRKLQKLAVPKPVSVRWHQHRTNPAQCQTLLPGSTASTAWNQPVLLNGLQLSRGCQKVRHMLRSPCSQHQPCMVRYQTPCVHDAVCCTNLLITMFIWFTTMQPLGPGMACDSRGTTAA